MGFRCFFAIFFVMGTPHAILFSDLVKLSEKYLVLNSWPKRTFSYGEIQVLVENVCNIIYNVKYNSKFVTSGAK